MQGLAIQQLADFAIDLVAQQREAPVRELHADLIAAARLELHFHDGVPGQALQHAVVGDGALSAFGVLGLLGIHHAHAQGLSLLDQVALEGAAVLGDLAHEDGLVHPVHLVELEHLLKAREGFGGLGEHEHAAGPAIDAVHDEELEALEAAALVVVRDGIGQGGFLAALGGYGEEARGLVHEEEVRVLVEDLVGIHGRDAGPGLEVVLELGVEVRMDGSAHLHALPVLAGHFAVHLDEARIQKALGLPDAESELVLHDGGERCFSLDFPLFVDARHGQLLCSRGVPNQRRAVYQKTTEGPICLALKMPGPRGGSLGDAAVWWGSEFKWSKLYADNLQLNMNRI